MAAHDTAQLARRSSPDIGDVRPRMAKVDLRKAETHEATRKQIGDAIDRCRTLCRLSLKEFAQALDREERQVARWIAGTERPQLDAIFANTQLHLAFVQALAELANAEVVTTITIRRTA